jgi:hypothetical protein
MAMSPCFRINEVLHPVAPAVVISTTFILKCACGLFFKMKVVLDMKIIGGSTAMIAFLACT